MQDLRLAVRALRATPIVSVVAALSLALGIGANTAIFSLLNGLLLRSLPVSAPDQLFIVSNAGGSSDIATRAALKAAGIDPDKDVDIIAVGSHANRTAALLAGTIDAGVDDPPEDLELVKAGLTPLIDLASQKLPAANTGVIMQRTYLTANKATVQAYVDSLVIARVRMKADKAGAVAVLGKYFKLDNQDALNSAYDFFMNEVTVPYLYPEVTQFKDAVEILGKTNDKIKTVDIAKMLDRSFMQSAQDRKLGG